MDNSTTPDNVLYCFLNLIMVRAPIYQQQSFDKSL